MDTLADEMEAVLIPSTVQDLEVKNPLEEKLMDAI